MKEVFVNCGVKYNSNSEINMFWYVLKAIPLAFSINLSEQNKFSLVFTSQTAVGLFFDSQKEILVNIFQNKSLEKSCAVGKETSLYLEQNYKKYFPNEQINPVFFKEKEGLFYLLCNNTFAQNSTVFILTAVNGKTDDVLQKISALNLNFNCIKIPIYKLEPNYSSFLQELFIQVDTKFIFNCKSGQVLNEVVSQLLTFFHCKAVHELPSDIYFSIDKSSTKKAAQMNEVVDRLWT